ncbi:RNA methyltransferase TrmH [Dissulfurispira thermophila]|uniref:RNA methyltransferase TrmH n=2 Tax=root TaxID=1 RepID=A0A7G1H492_9BACT|nr:RNA methyltransferase [Dissulfurispira thermophila]BCB96726.1 RNA methyltransferase TrmH [Dissulfurispira thermophila]
MRFITITSPVNAIIKEALKIKQKYARYRHEAFFIEGPHLIEMAVASPHVEIKRVFFTEEFSNKKEGQRLLRLIISSIKCQPPRDIFIRVSEQVLNKLSDTETPQGIAAVMSCKIARLDGISFKEVPFLVVCDGIQDPGNLGTIIRVSDAAGADAVIILPNTCDAFMPKAIRATAGSLFNIPIIYSGLETLFDFIESKNISLYAADVHAQMSIYEFDFKLPVAIAFGNEAHGVSEVLLKRAKGLKIPILGKAESLNVAMAASVCLYEVVRQRIY